jgi:hypothetical protein
MEERGSAAAPPVRLYRTSFSAAMANTKKVGPLAKCGLEAAVPNVASSHHPEGGRPWGDKKAG